MELLLTPARVYVVPTDLGIYLTAFLFIVSTQLLIWAIARYSADIEIWRCLGFCAIAGIVTMLGLSIGGFGTINGLLAGWCFGAFAGYLMAGFIYDLELWQRIVISVVAPPLALLSLITGYWLKGLIYTHVLS